MPMSGGGGGGGGGASTSGIIVGGYSCPAGVAVNDWVYLSAANTVDKADATSIATAPCIGIVTDKPTPTTADVMQAGGPVTVGSGMTPGVKVWLDKVAGKHTQAPPSLAGNVVQELGYAKSATEIVALVDNDYIEIL